MEQRSLAIELNNTEPTNTNYYNCLSIEISMEQNIYTNNVILKRTKQKQFLISFPYDYYKKRFLLNQNTIIFYPFS